MIGELKQKICAYRYCGKTYTPKSNNSKYCRRKCNEKTSSETRKQKLKTDSDFKKHFYEVKSKRFEYRYHNDPVFKEKHNEKNKEYSTTEIGRQKQSDATLRWYYRKHEENKISQAKRKRDRYANDDEYKKHTLDRNRKNRKKNGWGTSSKKPGILLWSNPFPDDIEVDNNHIVYFKKHKTGLTIPIPKITHQKVSGHHLKEHLEHNKKWIEKIYCFDISSIGIR